MDLQRLTPSDLPFVGTWTRLGRSLKAIRDSLRHWWQWETDWAEMTLVEECLPVADKAKMHWYLLQQQWEEESTQSAESQTNLRCFNCGFQLRSVKSSIIPPCPECERTVFTLLK